MYHTEPRKRLGLTERARAGCRSAYPGSVTIWLPFNRMQSIPSDMIEWWCGKPNHNPSPIFPEKTLSLKPSTHWTFGHRQFKKKTPGLLNIGRQRRWRHPTKPLSPKKTKNSSHDIFDICCSATADRAGCDSWLSMMFGCTFLAVHIGLASLLA